MAADSVISLRGSAEIITEFFTLTGNILFVYARSILFQRGIYPPEDFKKIKCYGLSLLVSCDSSLQAYLSKVMAQLTCWLEQKALQRFVLVLSDIDSRHVVERWQFDVFVEDCSNNTNGKKLEEIRKEIQAVIRQITASVTFLPILEGNYSFDLLVYTDKKKTTEIPEEWEDSDSRYVQNADHVRLRSFSTSFHKVEPTVAYKVTI
ncbi:mitotic spindle assembly checkpoint protein MAD2A [Rozella allomycis CSF55]|uniref:Mitotic spindle assembly checkpoint protein MAD2A n=1 Tax=Rozella allomycis (strain CSF55) TaxID=988480 RepID=A0A075B4M0_ROZAC|nr:Mitotic spindle checkpoint protein Mad2 domain-containing protein [Rozella allomycis CSF55]RKP20663.1 mitotic spindle assembly checkpoint protein MAD2A [Rozella allomycis CSF55]|eukprot:EPZ36287.1 Mitotic spindle checkpoint protein Mad2 domain-containing protein [Rozella allomycis CSF55]